MMTAMSKKNFRNKITFKSERPRLMEYKDKRQSKEDEKKEKNEIFFLHPEILPVSTVKDILNRKGATHEFLDSQTDQDLRNLFYKHVTPKPQREYKMNRTGKFLHRLRMRHNRVKGPKEDWECMVLSSSAGSSSNPRHVIPSSKEMSHERLKPVPTSCINTDRKMIKLGSSKSSSHDSQQVGSEKRKSEHQQRSMVGISVNKKTSGQMGKTESMSPEMKKRKLISWP